MRFKNRVEKDGFAHLEIILAFTIFVSFTIFLLAVLSPTKKSLLEESILFNVKNSFFENITVEVRSSLIDTRVSGSCPPEKAGPCVPTEFDIGKGIFARQVNSSNNCSYYIFNSEEFPDNPGYGSCNNQNKNYSIGHIERLDVVSNNSLKELEGEYYNDYDKAKERFGVPPTVDFAIISDNYSLERTIPDEVEVISGVYRERVLYGNGSMINQDFIIKIW